MKLIVFDVVGYIAQFRKFYSTTSSLSYAFPPRTAIAGMVACILGYERDSYYEFFSSKRCKIGLQLRKPVRRIVHTVNYLMTDEPLTLDKLRGRSDPAQVHVEYVVAESWEFSELCYRIFFHNESEEVMKDLEYRLRERRFYYPPSLGTANNLADLNYIGTVEAELSCPEGEVNISTVIPSSLVSFVSPSEGLRIYIEERMPADYSADRKIKRVENYIYEGSGKPIRARIDGDIFRCIIEDEEILGTFM